MSLIEKCKKLEERINARTEAMTKEQILAHNTKMFDAHFNGGDADGRIFVHPQECEKPAKDGKECGYVYVGVYKPVGNFGTKVESVKIYESSNVERDGQGVQVYKNPKMLKNKNGGNTFTLRELAEFDYEHTGGKVWNPWAFHSSKNKNKMQATKEVVSEVVQRHWNNLKNNHIL